MKLKDIYNMFCLAGYESDKGTIHSYIDIYADILAPYKETALNVLEIGLFKGNSLRMWQEYFSGTVYGIDCDIKPHGGMADLTGMVESGKYNIKIFDACNPLLVEENFGKIKFDVIIEDASHDIEQQIELFKLYSNYMNKDGIYIIEDIQNLENSERLINLVKSKNKVKVLDRRYIKNRYDDVLIVIYF